MKQDSTQAIVFFANEGEEKKDQLATPELPPTKEPFAERTKKLLGFPNSKKVAAKNEKGEDIEKEEPTDEDDLYGALEEQCNELKTLRKALAAANEKIESMPADAAQAGEALKLATAQVAELNGTITQLKEANAANEALVEEQGRTLDHYVESLAGAAEKVEKISGELAAANEKAVAAEQKADAEHKAFANERALRAKPLLDKAIEEGRITLADRPAHEASFANEADFDAVAGKLAALTPQVKTQSQTGNLGSREAAAGDPKAAGKRLIEMANEAIEAAKKDGKRLTYETAYANACVSNEGKPLYDALLATRKDNHPEE